MLTTEITKQMVEAWKRLYDIYRSSLRPNRKTGSELDDYFKKKYSYRRYENDKFKKIVELNILENDYSRSKLPFGVYPNIECYCVEDVLIGIDLSSGEFHVESEDIKKASSIYDDLFVYRGLDKNELKNCYLVAEYVKLTKV